MGELVAADAELAVARTFEQPHPVFALVRRDTLAHLTHSSRAADADRPLVRDAPFVEVRFDDEAEAFRNINTHDELRAQSASAA